MRAARDERFLPRLLLVSGGLLIWAAHFLFVYVFAALACARGFADTQLLGVGLVPFAIGAATVAALLALAWLMPRALRDERSARGTDPQAQRFLRFLAIAIAAYSAAAVLLQALPVLALPVCV